MTNQRALHHACALTTNILTPVHTFLSLHTLITN
jgi:hypothetical protein